MSNQTRGKLIATCVLCTQIVAACFAPVIQSDDGVSQPAESKKSVTAESALFVVTVNHKYGFINQKGELVIPATFQKSYPFSDGLAAVQVDKLWGFIDEKGQMVIEPQFALVGLFSDGLAYFLDEQITRRWGYIDKTGRVTIKPQFDCAEQFRNGIARVGIETLKSKIQRRIADVGIDCDDRFIDRTGKYVPDPGRMRFATGKPGELIPFKEKELVGYLDSQGKVVIKPQFEAGSTFSEDLASVYEKGLYGYIDMTGAFVIRPRFEYSNDFSEGLAGVRLGEKGWGFIDHTGKVVIPPKFAWVYGGFRHGLAEVAFERKIAYINKKGEWVWPPTE